MLQAMPSTQESEAIAEVFWRAFVALPQVQQQAVLKRLVKEVQIRPSTRALQQPSATEHSETVEIILNRLQGHGRGEHLTEKLLQSRNEDRSLDRSNNEQRLSA